MDRRVPFVAEAKQTDAACTTGCVRSGTGPTTVDRCDRAGAGQRYRTRPSARRTAIGRSSNRRPAAPPVVLLKCTVPSCIARSGAQPSGPTTAIRGDAPRGRPSIRSRVEYSFIG